MKAFLLLLALLSFTFGDVWVNGYLKSNGTYVGGHYRSSPNSSKLDNFSSAGRVNPYTGVKGYKNPYTTSKKVAKAGSYNSLFIKKQNISTFKPIKF